MTRGSRQGWVCVEHREGFDELGQGEETAHDLERRERCRGGVPSQPPCLDRASAFQDQGGQTHSLIIAEEKEGETCEFDEAERRGSLSGWTLVARQAGAAAR